MEMEKELIFTIEDKIARIVMNRPDSRNAFSRNMVALMEEALLEALGRQKEIRGLVLTGTAPAFCAGADLKERRDMDQAEVIRFLYKVNSLFNLLEELPYPTVSLINGFAFGGGLELALCTDFRIVSKEAQLGLTETRLGIIPGAGGTQRLPRLIGPARAKRLIYSGKRVSAPEAVELSLADEVSGSGEELEKAGRQLLAEFENSAPVAVAQAKFAIRHGSQVDLKNGLAIESKAYQITLGTEDRLEALAAFKEKRKPNFQGK